MPTTRSALAVAALLGALASTACQPTDSTSAANATLEITVTRDGEAIPDLEVSVFDGVLDDPSGLVTTQTDGRGIATLDVAGGHAYRVGASLQVPTAEDPACVVLFDDVEEVEVDPDDAVEVDLELEPVAGGRAICQTE